MQPLITGRELSKVLRIHHLPQEVFEGAVVYDLGCGESDLGGELAIRGIHASVIGYDQNRQVIAESQFDNSHTTKVHADLTRLPAEDETADIVLATYSLPLWATSPAEIVGFFSEACRAVKTGGVLSVFPTHMVAHWPNDTPETITERHETISHEVAKIGIGRWEPLTPNSFSSDTLTVRKI